MSIKLLDTIYKLTDNADKLDGKHASEFAASSHGVHWGGFTVRGSGYTWGKLIESNGYTPLFWLNSSSSGGIGFSDKDTQTSMQIDGFFYQNEGAFKVLDENNFSTYAALKSHTHDDRYFTESEINTKLGNYLPLTGGTLSGTLTMQQRIVMDKGVAIQFKNDGGYSTERLLIPYAGHDYAFSIYDGAYWGKIWHSANDGSGSGLDADTLDNYHRKGLYSSIPAWINANEYTKTITVNGDANTYYPVVISTPTDKEFPGYISVWKNLGSTTASYSGNHSNGTSSMWLTYEVRNWYWDGNGGYLKCWYRSMPYATLCAKAEAAGSGVGALVVYLRGGGTQYKVSSTYGASATVYLSSTNIGDSTYPVNVSPTTSIGNQGMLSNAYLGYGGISGSSGSVRDAGNGTEITLKYSSGGFSSNPSYLAAWNSYQITYVSPSNVTVGNATTATKLGTDAGSSTNPVYFSGGKPVACTYSLNKTVPSDAKFTDTNTWRGITDSYSGTASDTSLSQKGGNALYNALVNGYASSAGSAGALTNLARTSQAAWGTLTSANGYKDIGSWNESDGSGGSWSIQSKGGQISMQIDGEYYANEGKNKVLHTGNTYVSNGYGVINGSTITTINYASSAGSADFAGLLTKQGGTSTGVATWNPKSSWTKVWGQKFINTGISSDSGDVLYYLRASSYSSSGTELCVCIDGDYYAGTGQYKVIHEGNIGSQSVNYASSSGNADTVDGYHASSLWRSDGGSWNPGANISLPATANDQEWSFDITRNGKTGCYWHVWDSSLGSCLKVEADSGKVTASYTFNCATLQIGGQTITFTT